MDTSRNARFVRALRNAADEFLKVELGRDAARSDISPDGSAFSYDLDDECRGDLLVVVVSNVKTQQVRWKMMAMEAPAEAPMQADKARDIERERR